jgi:hypothetical protein
MKYLVRTWYLSNGDSQSHVLHGKTSSLLESSAFGESALDEPNLAWE